MHLMFEQSLARHLTFIKLKTVPFTSVLFWKEGCQVFSFAFQERDVFSIRTCVMQNIS